MTLKIINFWSKLGPGVVTGASDDDPSGIATYSQAGAQFGLATLWTALLTYPLMYGIQEMCGRIGIVTEQGLAGVIKTYYSKLLLYLVLLLMIPAVTLNIAADLAAMGAVSNLLLPIVSPIVFDFIYAILILFFMIKCKYTVCANILKWLCLSLLFYVLIPFLVQLNFSDIIIATFLPRFEWNYEYSMILVAILGTTISPYLFFWQTRMSVEDKIHTRHTHLREHISIMKNDVNIGMLFSNLIMYFIILTTASVLFPKGLTNIKTVEDASQALTPLAGEFAGLLFSLGIIGTGLLTIPVLTGCLAYMTGELFNLPVGLDKKPQKASAFYAIMFITLALAFALNAMNLNPIKALIYTAVLYGLISPFLIALILLISNNPKIMGKHVNNWIANLLGILVFLLMSLASVLMVYHA